MFSNNEKEEIWLTEGIHMDILINNFLEWYERNPEIKERDNYIVSSIGTALRGKDREFIRGFILAVRGFIAMDYELKQIDELKTNKIRVMTNKED